MIFENQFLGKMKEVRVKTFSPFKLLLYGFGSILGLFPVIIVMLLKAAVVLTIWNVLLVPVGFFALNFSAAFGLVSIMALLTSQRQSKSYLEGAIDIGSKIFIFWAIAMLFAYFS